MGRKPPEETRARFWALEDLSFELKQGTTTGLIGRNGAGKTTLLKVISRITRPTKGRAVIKGRVGSLLEVGTGFHPELSGRENVLLNGAILGMSRGEVLSKFDQIVDFAQISEFIDTPVKRYSSGMTMRLAFSVAAHLEPEVMLVDEVLAVGDNEFQKRCLNRIIEIAEEGRTVVFVSHNIGSVERVCNNALLLNEGRLIALGPTQEVVETYHKMAAPDQESEEEILSGDLREPKFFKWSLSSDTSMGSYSMTSGGSGEFTFRLAVPERLRGVFFGMAVYTAENDLATALSSFDLEGAARDLEPGLYDITFKVPSLPLGRGQYYVRASLVAERQGPLVRWEAQPAFEVSKKRESVQVPPPLEGIVALEGTFDLQASPLERAAGRP